MQDVKGLVGVFTGAGEGMGRAMVLNLARAGMNIAVLDINEEAARTTATDCIEVGVNAVGIRCDVTLLSDLDAAASRIKAALGAVNLLWVHAGVGLGGEEGFLGAKRNSIRWMYAVNVDGVIDTVRTFVPAMKQQSGWRHVGITGSMAGLVQCLPGGPVTYAASKYATVGIGESLRVELEPFGIGVTLFCPGSTSTRMWDGARARPDRYGGPQPLPEEYGRRLREIGMNADEVAAYAIGAARLGQFYAIMPETAERAKRVEERFRNMEQAIYLPKAMRNRSV